MFCNGGAERALLRLSEEHSVIRLGWRRVSQSPLVIGRFGYSQK